MSLSKTCKAYTEIRNCLTELQEGVVLAIDPSIGSSSSMPGWAVYRAGELHASGTLKINPLHSIPLRLAAVAAGMKVLIEDHAPQALVYENIPAQRQGGGNAVAHASLLMALGTILSVPGPSHHVGLYPMSWKRLARPSYKKGDMEDAIEVGWIAIQEAIRIHEEDPPGLFGKRKRRVAREASRKKTTRVHTRGGPTNSGTKRVRGCA
jgi:hypothetical protein